MGHWQYSGLIPSDWVGFIYLIESPTGKKYVGRKNRYIKRSKKKESNWRTYTGSSKDLKADIKHFGKDQFTFKILTFCGTLGALAIEETKEILKRNALFSKQYYNKYIYLKLINSRK